MKQPTLQAALAPIFLFAALGVNAGTVTFSASDPVGDHVPGTIDLTGFGLVVDNLTGEYEATFSADVASPFLGSFTIELGLPHAFTDVAPSIVLDLGEATTSVTSGPHVNSYLIGLASGEEVKIYDTLFFPPTNLATGRTADGFIPLSVRVTETAVTAGGVGFLPPLIEVYDTLEAQTSTVSAVPLPAGIWLFLSALGVLGLRFRPGRLGAH